MVMVKIDDTTTSMLVDSGAQSTVLGKKQFDNLVRNGLKVKLKPEERNLRVYGNGYLPVVGKFEASIQCFGRKTMETILVTQGEGRCLLGSSAAKRLHVLRVGPELRNVANVFPVRSGIGGIVDRFPAVFSGVGKLSGYQLKLHIDPEVRPVAQKPRRIPYPLKENVTRKINELVDLDIIEKVSGPTTWVSPAVFAPKPDKDDVHICVDMRCANEAIRREKIPIPTVDEVLEELNGSTVFSKLDMNMGFHQIELEESSRDITTFSAGDSLFRYKRLSFGINSAPEQYQNIVRQTIAGCPGATNIADDIVVHGKTTEEHDRNLVTLLNGPNLVSHEMEEFLDELGIKHKKTIPLWPRANGEVERQNKSLLKAMRAAQAERKPWQQELRKYLLAYRSTPHTTTGVSPAELLYGRKIRTKMPEFEGNEEEERSGTTDQQARDQDAEKKKRGAEAANRRAAESDVAEGDKVLLLQRKQNKLCTTYDPDPYSVVSKKGDLVVIERGETQLKRNVGHVRSFIGSTPQIRQPEHVGIQPLAQPMAQQPVAESATLPVPEQVETLPPEPVTKPMLEPPSQPVVVRVPEQTSEPRRSMRQRIEPRWLKDYVTWKTELS